VHSWDLEWFPVRSESSLRNALPQGKESVLQNKTEEKRDMRICERERERERKDIPANNRQEQCMQPKKRGGGGDWEESASKWASFKTNG
jgi:hypothetical protein